MAVEIGGYKPQSLGRKLVYSAGSFAGSMAPGTFAAFAMFFYVDLLAMKPSHFALAMVEIAAQPASAIWGMRLLLAAVPMVVVLLALIVWRFYPLHGGYLESIKFQVRKLHEDKVQRLGGEGGGPGISPAGGTPVRG